MFTLSRLLIRLLLTPIGIMILGVLFALIGADLIRLGLERVPERGELTQVAGTVTRVTKTWKSGQKDRSKISNVRYELEIADSGTPVTVLDIAEKDLRAIPVEQMLAGTASPRAVVDNEDAAQILAGRPVTALFLSKKISGQRASDPWELSTGSYTLVSYEQSRDRQVQVQAFMLKAAPYVMGTGGILLLLGGSRRWARRQGRA
jgi:hypothetical protein